MKDEFNGQIITTYNTHMPSRFHFEKVEMAFAPWFRTGQGDSNKRVGGRRLSPRRSHDVYDYDVLFRDLAAEISVVKLDGRKWNYGPPFCLLSARRGVYGDSIADVHSAVCYVIVPCSRVVKVREVKVLIRTAVLNQGAKRVWNTEDLEMICGTDTMPPGFN